MSSRYARHPSLARSGNEPSAAVPDRTLPVRHGARASSLAPSSLSLNNPRSRIVTSFVLTLSILGDDIVPVAHRYRPRHPSASPIWQVLHYHWDRFRRTQSVHDDHLDQTVRAFLRCGDFRSGFTRWRCPGCEHEFLLAFTCKQRGLCAACHQRRTLTLAPHIAETVCAPVPHRHIVLTVPRLLRPVFRRDRTLITELFHAAQEVLNLWLRERTGVTNGQPGIVAAAQTFGDFLTWHPHLHLLVTAGVFRADGSFQIAPLGGWRELAELWRHAVIRRLRQHRSISATLATKLLSWTNSGFTLDAGEAPLAADDLAGRTHLAEYLIRSPFSLEKITYEPATGHILYRSEKHWRTKRNFEVFSAHQFIEALIAQLPLKGVPMLRYYGHYSNKSRGMRRAAQRKYKATSATALSPAPRRPRICWQQLIMKVWGADPLECPLCQGRLRLIEVIEEEKDIAQVLSPLGLCHGKAQDLRQPPAHAPPWTLVDASTGELSTTVPATSPLPTTRRSKSESLAWRQYVFGEYSTDPDDDFDQCGCEAPPCYDEAPDGIDQLTLFDDGYQPDPEEGEPVFWSDAAVQDFPEDDYIQYDPADIA